MAVSQGEKASADVTPHGAASPGAPDVPRRLPSDVTNTGVWTEDSNPRRRARINARGGPTAIWPDLPLLSKQMRVSPHDARRTPGPKANREWHVSSRAFG